MINIEDFLGIFWIILRHYNDIDWTKPKNETYHEQTQFAQVTYFVCAALSCFQKFKKLYPGTLDFRVGNSICCSKSQLANKVVV